MDQTVTPPNASWALEIDSIPRAVTAQSWDDATHIRLQSDSGAAPTVDVTIELLVEDDMLHALAGRNVLPFGPETVPAG